MQYEQYKRTECAYTVVYNTIQIGGLVQYKTVHTSEYMRAQTSTLYHIQNSVHTLTTMRMQASICNVKMCIITIDTYAHGYIHYKRASV